MQIAVLKERRPGEQRVAATPDSVKKLVALGCTVAVETGAGLGAGFADADYIGAGANLRPDAQAAADGAGIVIKVQRPMSDADGGQDEIGTLPQGAILVGQLGALSSPATMRLLADRGVVSFALELMPRISRAQAMDVLSSQSSLAGYKAVIDAAAAFSRPMPLMMTSAGTIAPARVVVFGAGVAGLQAIATARRLGAVVYATDVRYAAKEQVESLGGKFIVVDEERMKAAESDDGYAKEMDVDFQRKQAEAVRAEVLKADIIITTALVPGRPAPRLVTADMIAGMKAGSVIVDLAGEAGGNVEGSQRNHTIRTANGVTLMAPTDLPSRLPRDASALFSRNVLNFVSLMIEKGSGALKIDWNDDLIKGTLVTRESQVVHPALQTR